MEDEVNKSMMMMMMINLGNRLDGGDIWRLKVRNLKPLQDKVDNAEESLAQDEAL